MGGVRRSNGGKGNPAWNGNGGEVEAISEIKSAEMETFNPEADKRMAFRDFQVVVCHSKIKRTEELRRRFPCI